jgi:hypothetical protein
LVLDCFGTDETVKTMKKDTNKIDAKFRYVIM